MADIHSRVRSAPSSTARTSDRRKLRTPNTQACAITCDQSHPLYTP